MMRTLTPLAFLLLVTATDKPQSEFLQVENRDFVKNLTFSGELLSVEKFIVSVPQVYGRPNMVISYLAPEGTYVRPGEILVQFDVSELETERLDRENEREDARIQIAQKEAEIETRYQDLMLELATATKNLKVAELHRNIDPSLIPRADTEKYKFDYSNALIEVEKAQERLDTLEKSRDAELEVERLQFERADLRLKRLTTGVERMTIRAPMPGLVLYGKNPLRAGKIQKGDQLWTGVPVIYLPNMNNVSVSTYIYDADFPLLKVGESAEVVLDSAPNRLFHGTLVSLSEVARSRTFRSQLKAFRAEVHLSEVDPELMKPGMTARVKMPVVRPDSLLVPRKAVKLERDGTTRVLLAAPEERWATVEIVDSNETDVLVTGNVRAGDRLLPPGSENETGPIGSEIDWITIEKQDLKFSVAGSGILEAEKSVSIGPPSVRRIWRFKIVSLAPEGTDVHVGDPLVTFDPSEIQRRLRDETSRLGTVEEELEKTQASEELKVKDLELQLEEARVEMDKAKNKLVQAREFESILTVKEAEYEAELAEARVGFLEKKLSSVKRNVSLQLELLEDQRDLRQARIEVLEQAVGAMTVTAPVAGVVVYEANWRNEKAQVGSDVNRVEKILSLPDLDTLVVKGQVAEVDAGKISVGQEVEVTLDALPNRIFSGNIKSISTIFTPVSYDRPTKVLEFTVELDEVDTGVMRPGMVAKLQAITEVFEDVFAVPLSMVHVEDGVSYLWVKTQDGPKRRKVEVEKDNGLIAVIESGLQEGEEVADTPPSSES